MTSKMMLYIFKWINQQLSFVKMKKEEKSTPVSSKTKSLYKYELQATNQILRDTLDLYPSSLHSTAHTNRNKNAQLQQFDEYLFDENSSNRNVKTAKNENELLKQNSAHTLNKQGKFSCSNNIFEVNQQIKKYLFKEAFSKQKYKYFKKQIEKDVENGHSSHFYSCSSENEANSMKKLHAQFEKSKQSSSKKNRNVDAKIELKRQRRGLASISLKVKNIVAKKGKMTFKEVSEQVLKETEDDLPNDIEERQKQTKNIRRRVYDALNVLVSVKILGKQDKYVTLTDLTNIPGKKLSFHWEQITQKNRILDEKLASYKQKQKHLNSLKQRYQEILLLHERNKNYLDVFCKNDRNSKPSQRDEFLISPSHDRYYFPLIFLIPPKAAQQRMIVSIELEGGPSECIKRFTIEGSEHILTQLQILNFLNLHLQVEDKEVDYIRHQIDSLDNINPMKYLDDSISMHNGRLFDYDDDIYLED